MLTEARKAFRHGFVLNEPELRRLVDTAVEQVRKAIQNEPVVVFVVKFKNGTVTECANVEELLALENAGPKKIIRLGLNVDDGGDIERIEPKVRIAVRFYNLIEEDDERRSISYIIKGEARDWVLVTASEIEDRIEKVKCFGIHALLQVQGRSFSFLLFPLATLIFMFGSFHAMTSAPRAHLVRDALASGQQLDAAKAISLLEQDGDRDREFLPMTILVRWGIAYPAASIVGILLLVMLAGYLHPSYVFAWADYSKVHQQRLSTRNYLYIGIVLALVIAVIADIIVAKLGIK